MKPVLIHTHFHKRRTGITRSIENVLPFFQDNFKTYVYGYNVEGKKISRRQLKQLLFSKKEVVVHCHRNNEILKFLYWRFLGAKFKLIATRHAETIPSKLTLYLLKKVDKVVTLIESMSSNLGIKNTIVGHGINIKKFQPNSVRNIPNVTQKNRIICAGRVRKAKGQHILLESASVLKNYKTWALIIVGKVDKPEYLKELKQLVHKHGIQNQVYFVEETPDIISYYQAAKIAVVPSFSEGFSLVTAEAMACECTVVATRNVGVHNTLITHNKSGYLFEAGNSNQLQKLLEQLLIDELPYLGKQAREEVVDNWSAQKEAAALTKIYLS